MRRVGGKARQGKARVRVLGDFDGGEDEADDDDDDDDGNAFPCQRLVVGLCPPSCSFYGWIIWMGAYLARALGEVEGDGDARDPDGFIVLSSSWVASGGSPFAKTSSSDKIYSFPFGMVCMRRRWAIYGVSSVASIDGLGGVEDDEEDGDGETFGLDATVTMVDRDLAIGSVLTLLFSHFSRLVVVLTTT
ncbi:hypothetical protein SUGI_0536970 [Cryptomeria japonica]|nr:hypothetical protein SUGI_0536970 [Cryptomeria japonica]